MIEFFRRLFRPYLELKRAIVNMKTGTAFRGIVYRRTGPYLILRQAELLQTLGTPQKGNPPVVDGEVLVANADIDFVQVIS